MKKNDYLLLIATGAYSFLFFHQNAGINFLIFNVLLIIVLFIKNNDVIKQKKWLWAMMLCLTSSVAVFYNSSALAIIANLFSLSLLAAFTFNSETSSIFSLLFSVYSIVSSFIRMIIDATSRNQKNENSESKKWYKLISIVIVLVLSILFFSLYKSSNPLFAENTKWINLDFISISWIFFTLGGFILLYGVYYHQPIKQIEAWENNLSITNAISTKEDQLIKRFETERFAGLLLFILLNAMLVILNVGDIQTLYLKGELPKGISHKDFVHSGVGIIIFSIIIATSLIMYLQRKEFNTIKNNKALLAGIYLWIIQNLLMLSSTTIRNDMYIEVYNYTYKRIGVYVWLLLAAIGLGIMFYKIYSQKSNWYLIKTNVAVWFSVLALGSLINWDVYITQYNLSNKPLKEVDFYYLFSLSDANIPELLAIRKHPELNHIRQQSNDVTLYRDYYLGYSYIQLLQDKLNHYLSDYTNDWRSFDIRDQRITNSIMSVEK